LVKELEEKLDSFDSSVRQSALRKLCGLVEAGAVDLPSASRKVNLHCHTFYSYNSYGYSPAKIAWLSRRRGLAAAAVIDFDALDGLEEFLTAGSVLNLKCCGGFETRVFFPEFADKQINSPGEPGIAYHIGAAIPRGNLDAKLGRFLQKMKATAQNRNIALMNKVNEYLKPVELDYEKDVTVLTPNGNATERHLCLAYARKAQQLFPDSDDLSNFWSDKLQIDAKELDLPEGVDLLMALRAKTMKQGASGYVKAIGSEFLKMKDVNDFILAAGGIPTAAWLDGTTEAERDLSGLLEREMAQGIAAINIIPDRNYTSGVSDDRLDNLVKAVSLAQELHLPVAVGTEMNSFGQKFVDDFDSHELKPMVDIFLKGAYIFYAHSVLERNCCLGYTSQWAKRKFSGRAEKNCFYQEVGFLLSPAKEDLIKGLGENVTTTEILKKLKG